MRGAFRAATATAAAAAAHHVVVFVVVVGHRVKVDEQVACPHVVDCTGYVRKGNQEKTRGTAMGGV